MYTPEDQSWKAAHRWLSNSDLSPEVQAKARRWLQSLWDDPRPFPCEPAPKEEADEAYSALDDTETVAGMVCLELDAIWKVDDIEREFEWVKFIRR